MSNVNVFGSENIDINNESQMSNIVNQEELHGTPDKQNTKKFTNQVSLKNGDSIVVSALVWGVYSPVEHSSNVNSVIATLNVRYENKYTYTTDTYGNQGYVYINNKKGTTICRIIYTLYTNGYFTSVVDW